MKSSDINRTEFVGTISQMFDRDPREAWRLLDQMAEAVDTGADRGDLLAIAREELSRLPTLQ